MAASLPGSPVGPAALRTLALVGPAAAGKTTLAEALLARAGAIHTPGTVERGSTVSDFDPLEKRMQHSLNSAVMHLAHADTRIHVIDTPGGPDFLGQSLPALEAVETAAIVINAATGIEPVARRMMDYAAARHLDRLIIVNRIDVPGVKLPQVLADIQAAFGKECLPLNLPADGGARVVDCFFNRTGSSDFGDVDAAHRALVEQVVEVDGAFVDRYLNDGDVPATELHAPLEQALREGHLIPVVFTSAKSGAGIAELLDVIVQLLPNPTEANPPDFLRDDIAGGEPEAMHATPDPAAHVLAHVFKVTVDPFVGRLGIFRVHQGTITQNMQLYVGHGRKPFKVSHLYLVQGKELVEVQQAVPGDIAAVAKVDALQYDAVLHDAADDERIHLLPLDLPKPVHGIAIEPKRHGDEQRLWEILGKLIDEDPCLKVEHVAVNNESVVYGLGELHLRVLLERMKETYKFEVNTRPPRIAYRETITGKAEGHHRHKKQTGGAGQFGEVFLRVESLPAGTGYEFVDAVKGGTIPTAFIPAVEKGVREALTLGAISGHPVVDVRVIVYDGKSHSVDSKEIAFVTAARKATLGALREARPVVLEPIVNIEITAPDGTLGDITGDLSAKRGLVTGTANGMPGSMVVRGQVPLSELSNYQSRLNALTGGQGRYVIEFAHYQAVPPNVQQQLCAAYQAHDED
ncbi:MAG: elongation factor G [Rubrivivax sp.]|nr:elongation factor G [Rubrivivax sp.]